jgi:hypothetical protein
MYDNFHYSMLQRVRFFEICYDGTIITIRTLFLVNIFYKSLMNECRLSSFNSNVNTKSGNNILFRFYVIVNVNTMSGKIF